MTRPHVDKQTVFTSNNWAAAAAENSSKVFPSSWESTRVWQVWGESRDKKNKQTKKMGWWWTPGRTNPELVGHINNPPSHQSLQQIKNCVHLKSNYPPYRQGLTHVNDAWNSTAFFAWSKEGRGEERRARWCTGATRWRKRSAMIFSSASCSSESKAQTWLNMKREASLTSIVPFFSSFHLAKIWNYRILLLYGTCTWRMRRFLSENMNKDVEKWRFMHVLVSNLTLISGRKDWHTRL